MGNRVKKSYNRISGIYHLLEWPMEKAFSTWRRQLLSEAAGKTLEAGIGTGTNIPHYPDNVELMGIDFSEKMLEKAKKKAEGKNNIELCLMDTENLAFDSNSFDTVVSTFVFCSVSDPVKGLKELRRVCKNGGKLLMMEHVRSNHSLTGRLMDVLNPIPYRIMGENINRRTCKHLINAGFRAEHIRLRKLWFDIILEFRVWNLKGSK